MQANKQAALVQELVRRQHVSCPAHPAFREPDEDQVGNGIRSDDAPHVVSAPSAAAARLESYFASPSFDRIAATPSAMVAKMPTLLHYKTATLSAKLDGLYDLLPRADVSKMVIRSPFLLGLSSQTLATRFQALQTAFPDANVQRMVEYYPSLLECKVGKVIGNLKALQHMFPETVNTVAVVEYMPTLLLSNMQKVEEKYARMQILCMHRPRWHKDLTASQQKPATFARLLGVSHRVIDRLSFLMEHLDLADLAASTIMLMSRSKFATRFEQFEAWQQQRHAAQHISTWQSDDALSLLDSLNQPLRLALGSETHSRKKEIAAG
ncbi:hypothetical protein WJX77_005888 [Trebouxia sp. C0004]